ARFGAGTGGGARFGAGADAGLGEPIDFHRRLPGYRPTPLVEAPAIASLLGVGRVLVKDESSRFGLPAFKVLGASWAVYRALEERLRTSTGDGGDGDSLASFGFSEWESLEDLARHVAACGPLSLSAATDGNHGRAVARVARWLGLRASIYVPANTVAARIEAIEGEGASCTVVEGSYDDAVRRSALDAGPTCLVISDTSWPGYTAVPGWVIDGYSTIFREVEEQLPEMGLGRADVAVVPIGVGALAAAAVRNLRRGEEDLAGARPAIVGVEPLHAACVLQSARAGRLLTLGGPQDSIMAGLNCGTPSELAFSDVAAGVDVFVAIEDEPVREAMRHLARAGIVSGETGAAALAGVSELLASRDATKARSQLGLGSSSTALLLSTEGATDRVAYDESVGTAGGSAAERTPAR
ncbi:MAG: diaminopropionate ammonia-lyase, partial [Acidimicrobiales bacterium]